MVEVMWDNKGDERVETELRMSRYFVNLGFNSCEQGLWARRVCSIILVTMHCCSSTGLAKSSSKKLGT